MTGFKKINSLFLSFILVFISVFTVYLKIDAVIIKMGIVTEPGTIPTGKLAVATLQTYLDEYLKQNINVSIDYIHGEDVVYSLCKAENTVGFIFDGMQKSELFDAIKQDGSLPRKTFSMGHAADKRFYIEARKI